MVERPRTRLLWYGLLFGTSSIFLLALLPPFLPAEMQVVVRRCFAPVCHQLPGRSPHIAGVPLAICDRCSGIYLGLVVGVAVTGWGHGLWKTLGQHGRFLLLGSLVPLGVDWVAPILGLWQSGPVGRGLTGLLFGVVAASYVTDRLLRRVARTAAPEGPGRT
ncbi:MAG: DUF2085 domain-containing protein [Salinibacter sp.]